MTQRSKIYDFIEDLETSQSEAGNIDNDAGAPEWLVIYSKMFPDLNNIDYVRDKALQAQQVDRQILFDNKVILNVEEKVDNYDNQRIALEIYSDYDRKVNGWMLKPSSSVWLAYKKAKLRQCLFLPVKELKYAWSRYGEDWTKLAEEETDDFKIAFANNKTYTSYSVCVPMNELISKVKGAKVIPY